MTDTGILLLWFFHVCICTEKLIRRTKTRVHIVHVISIIPKTAMPYVTHRPTISHVSVCLGGGT